MRVSLIAAKISTGQPTKDVKVGPADVVMNLCILDGNASFSAPLKPRRRSNLDILVIRRLCSGPMERLTKSMLRPRMSGSHSKVGISQQGENTERQRHSNALHDSTCHIQKSVKTIVSMSLQ